MTQNDLVQFWSDGSDEAWKTVQALMESKRYLHALFFCHLALEKLLKAKYAEKRDAPPPPIHNLVTIAQKAELPLSVLEKEQLAKIAKFNIEGRYGDGTLTLHKETTAEVAQEWVGIVQALLSSIRSR